MCCKAGKNQTEVRPKQAVLRRPPHKRNDQICRYASGAAKKNAKEQISKLEPAYSGSAPKELREAVHRESKTREGVKAEKSMQRTIHKIAAR